MARKYEMKLCENPYVFISWGCGVQSTTLCVMSALGMIPKVDAIITSDTGWEHSYTYKIRDWYIKWLREREIKVEIVSNGNIYTDEDRNNLTLPLWTGNSGAPLRRQCTGKYKIDPIRKKMREFCGVSPFNTGRTKKGLIKLYLGISMDEAERMADSNRDYIINTYPLVDLKMTRQDCINLLEENNLPVPRKSCCVCCPYQGASSWKYVKDNYKDEFNLAVDFDKKLRNISDRMLSLGYDFNLYLWKGLKPLEEEDFDSIVQSKDVTDVCDSGYCFI
jgi:hypothetical protein